jgi:hypothetical protein
MKGLALLLLAAPLQAQDGTRYRPTLGPLPYALTKSAVSASVYLVARELNVGRTISARDAESRWQADRLLMYATGWVPTHALRWVRAS